MNKNDQLQLAYLKQMETFDEIISEMQVKPSGIVAELTGESEETREYREIEKVGFPEEGGVLTFYKGYDLPKKGFPSLETVKTLDKVKRVSSILFTTAGQFWFIAFLFPFRLKKIWEYFLDSSHRYIEPLLLKENRYCDAVREVRRVCDVVGVDERLKNLVSLILEYDDAYRYRLQFVFQFLSRDDSAHKVVKKIFLNLEKRELSGRCKERWKLGRRVSWLIALLFRKKIRVFMEEVVFEKILFSPEDWKYSADKKKFRWYN